MRPFLALLCAVSLTAAAQAAELPDIALQIITPKGIRTVPLADMHQQLKTAQLKVFNPIYHRDMEYQGFWLDEVLRLVDFPSGPDILVMCRDGYTGFLPAASVGKHRWLLAFGEASGQWTLMDQRFEKVSPAPWYLVGSKKESFVKFPWPYQVVAIRPAWGW